jgi:hypothetical protein
VKSQGVTLSQDEIRGILSRADELARADGHVLRTQHGHWAHVIETLNSPQCPRTYLPILAVLLVARALKPKEELNVLDIQQQTSSRGYSAASIGKLVVPFAVEQGIDLRSKSSQIMNNQPFTFKARITPGMAKSTKSEFFNSFYGAAEQVNELTSASALEVLAALFDVCRKAETRSPEVVLVEGGLKALTALVGKTADFVSTHSDNGRVGQAFVAAVLDVLYGPNRVILGNTADPDASTPGDVQVVDDDGIWLWFEVKQKSVTTGDVETFLNKVQKVNGERIIYCALGNERYPHNIDPLRVARLADHAGIDISIFVSSADFMGATLKAAPGSFNSVASRLASAMLQRMDEALCSPETKAEYRTLL